MPLYRNKPQKPVQIEAEQWFPDQKLYDLKVRQQIAVIGGRGHGRQEFPQKDRYILETNEGDMELRPGWYVVRTDTGYIYTVSQESFEDYYEKI